VELDNPTQGYANPWGIVQTGDGNYLCVLHVGSQTMTVIDYPQLIAKALAGKDLSHGGPRRTVIPAGTTKSRKSYNSGPIRSGLRN
jgi:hypothetical protein